MHKKSILIFILGLAFFLSITACSKKPVETSSEASEVSRVSTESVSSSSEATSSEAPKEPIDPSAANKKLAVIYTKVLDSIDSYSFGEFTDNENVTYRYALVNMNSSDYPQLLVSQDISYGISNIKFFAANDAMTKEVTSEESIPVGVARTGGFRGNVLQNENHDALGYWSFSSGNGDAQAESITCSVEKDALHLIRKITASGKIDTLPKEKGSEIEFIDIQDRTMLENLSAVKDGAFRKTPKEKLTKPSQKSENNSTKDKNSLTAQIEEERAAGKMVVTGTVRVFSHDEMVKFQKLKKDIFPDHGETYLMLVMDKPNTLRLQASGSPESLHYGKYTGNLLTLRDDMARYEGQHITVSFGSDDGFLPSSFDLPVGTPIMKKIKVLK